ncbi:hypothetical protein [Siphonobacter sp. SORGH_AS_1065]|uniref:hypothetical protein n=1 Tax=Siphonobacter sp. SORGH_AS_1065 TaxID=3041795 RepID=UPI00278186FC|nr:hypothetical protein [Siphonobacter sp. SORGH_AS_1065]MDQ1085680.1 putative nucleic-acid-binding Zn-ribbon protein [Siphonobacter sp. SORGH_AS_1065]
MTHSAIVDEILKELIDNGITSRQVLSAHLRAKSIVLPKEEIINLIDEIEESELFEIKLINTKDGQDLIFSVNKYGRNIYKTYGSYSKYKYSEKLSDEDIVDLIFEELKVSNYGLVLDEFLRKNNILHSDKDLFRIYRTIKATDFIKDKTVLTQGGSVYFFEINDSGFKALSKIKYSEFYNKTNSNSQSPINYTINTLQNNINHGNNNTFNNSINIKDTKYLRNELSKLDISDGDINELVDIIDEDNDSNTTLLGHKTNKWVHKMLGKSLDGSWDIAINVAGGLLTEIIKSYLGYSS